MNLKEMRAAALKAANDIIMKAKGESRGLTAEEQVEVKGHFDEIDRLDGLIAEAAESDSLMAKMAGFKGETNDEPEDKPAASLGEHFVKSATGMYGKGAFGLLKSTRGFSVNAPEYKAAADVNMTPGVFETPILTQIDRTIVREYRRPTISDLLGSGSLGRGTNAVTYFVENGLMEGEFGMVAEGGQKPQLHALDPVTRTDAVRKIAGWWDTSDEMIEDLDFWVSEINNRGMHLLSMAEENQLLNGDGTGQNILGLLNRSGIQTEEEAVADDNPADTIFRALTKVQTATGMSADGIVINPADYQALRLSKDANGQYFGGGFFAGQYGDGGIVFQPPLWGVRTVVSAAIAPQTVLVGAFKAATTVYRKGGIRIESTNSDQGKFTKDIVTTRIEERLALACRYPAAVVKVTLAA